MRFLASWIAALTLSIGLASAQQAEAGGFRARAQLKPATSGVGFNPVDFYVLDMPLYLGLMELGLSEEEAFALSWRQGWDWDEDITCSFIGNIFDPGGSRSVRRQDGKS